MGISRPPEKRLSLVSFEDTSILRRFTILFLVSSVVPLAVLYYIYAQSGDPNDLGLTQFSFFMVMLLVVGGIFAAFVSMRSLLMRVINISRENNRTLMAFLGQETIQELSKGEDEIVILSRSFSAVTKKLEENIRSLEQAKKTLQVLMDKVGKGISDMQKIDAFLDLIVETINSALGADVSALMIQEEDQELVVKAVHGVPAQGIVGESLSARADSPLAGVLRDKKTTVISGMFAQGIGEGRLKEIFGENVLCVPLLYREQCKGLITLCRAGGEFSQEDTALVSSLAGQTAVALENARLNNDIEKTYFETVSALAMAVDAKNKNSRGHLGRMKDLVLMAGRKLGLEKTELDTLRDGAQLHDLGKIGIPDEVLLKEGPLTDEDWVIMRRHPEIGESIIRPVRSLGHLCDLVRHHHERLDGSGYPDGLKGDEISPLVRVLAVADVYDALTTERSYRARKSGPDAFALMRSMKDRLDQDIVEAFIEALKEKERET